MHDPEPPEDFLDLNVVVERLSLFRLNHRLPGREAHPEVVQGTAEFHHQIADTLLPQADPVFHDTAALDTAVDMLNPQPAVVQSLVGEVLLHRELLATGFLRRHEDRHLRQRQRQEAEILQQPTPRRQGIGGGLGNPEVMDTAAVGVAQKEDREGGIDEQDVFDGVVFFLAALTLRLFNRVVGADDAPFRPVMGKRGDAGATAGATATGAGSSASGADSSARGVTTAAASASDTPSRCARAASERVGASPRVRSVASSAGKRTWIHWLALPWSMPNRRPWTTWSM